VAFSTVTLTHRWANSDGSAASGVIRFQLTKRITNSGTSIVPASPLTVNLDSNGAISQALTSNADTGTTPTDSQWQVFVEVAGCSQEQYLITVPTGGGTVDLGALFPEAQQTQ
jgi:hypothetical protein